MCNIDATERLQLCLCLSYQDSDRCNPSGYQGTVGWKVETQTVYAISAVRL